MTEPPPRGTFSAQVTQWGMYDDYCEHFEKNNPPKGDKEHSVKTKIKHELPQDDLERFEMPIRIVERMVNQNTFDEVSQDFKYYEDMSDDYKDNMGTVLPLWKFCYEKSKKFTVTCISWNPIYHDLFAVGHGSYDFTKQMNGMVCFYTLKNPGFPEFIFETESGVMSLDFHPELSYLFCVGFYDGSVAIYNTRQSARTPLYYSTVKTGKHTEPVWSVRWMKCDHTNNLQFYSISGDSRDGVGGVHKCSNELVHFDVLILKMIDECDDPIEDAHVSNVDCGTAFDFHPKMDHIFLVATEEGFIHKCSKAYQSEYLLSYFAHDMAVYNVQWNTFHSDIFISCSADWTVKIWHHEKLLPLFIFDLGSPVNDVAWSKHSSTIFAASTSDGKLHVFDLNVNKYEALCSQSIVAKSKNKLTRIAFNQIHPIIVAGDEKGHIMTLKTSPNLRKKPKEKKGVECLKGPEAEIDKLNKILLTVG